MSATESRSIVEGIASAHLEKINHCEEMSVSSMARLDLYIERNGEFFNALMWVWTLEAWHGMHCFAQAPTCFCSPFHTNF